MEKTVFFVTENKFAEERIKKQESLFALGNGYMGLRGSLEERYIEEQRGLFIAGTFDRFDSTETSELPNGADVVGMDCGRRDDTGTGRSGSSDWGKG